ncbi:MAG TPA: aldo/keto reductase, partial [Candidatus Binatia bacterium]|nr:aldo/keto reductase [Candidatus Binatia bacterium]
MRTDSEQPRASRLGLGLAALGRPGYINLGHADDLERHYDVAAMTAHAHQVLDAAWAAGLRDFDTARSYGKAEEFLASWLAARRIEPQDVTVSSKWGYAYTAGWRVDAAVHEVKKHSLDRLEQQIAESRAILGRHLDLYQIHSATLSSGVLDDERVLERLGALRIEGLSIGLTVTGLDQSATVRRAIDVEVAGERLFASVQATWNVLERSAETALAEAHRAGVRVIVKEALANGRLTDRNREASFAAKRAVLDRLARRLETTIDAVALAAVLARPWTDLA